MGILNPSSDLSVNGLPLIRLWISQNRRYLECISLRIIYLLCLGATYFKRWEQKKKQRYYEYLYYHEINI